MTQLQADFKDFLSLLNAHRVEYLLIGGYAVGYHGYPRATVDLDVWIARTPDNAQRTVSVLRQFGFTDPVLTPGLFLEPDRIVRRPSRSRAAVCRCRPGIRPIASSRPRPAYTSARSSPPTWRSDASPASRVVLCRPPKRRRVLRGTF